MSAPTIIVAGLGRCGSSLTMQLLNAAGIRCLGTFPDFEDERTAENLTPELVESYAGGAMKVLDPHRNRIPRESNCIVIWLDRDSKEQAKSQIKMLRLAGMKGLSRADARGFNTRLREDRKDALASLNPEWPRLMLNFEGLIEHKAHHIGRIAAFVPGFNLTDKVIQTVIQRPSWCLHDMSIETQLASFGAAS